MPVKKEIQDSILSMMRFYAKLPNILIQVIDVRPAKFFSQFRQKIQLPFNLWKDIWRQRIDELTNGAVAIWFDVVFDVPHVPLPIGEQKL